MAFIMMDGKEIEVEDGSPMMQPAGELGVVYGCMGGTCGTCLITVEEGEENLSPLNSAEENYGLTQGEGKRLTCQCSIMHGEVRIKYDDF